MQGVISGRKEQGQDLRYFFEFTSSPPALSEMASTTVSKSATKKRKQPDAAPDARFAFTAEELADSPPPVDGASLAGPSTTTQDNDEEAEEEEEKEGGGLPAHLLPKSGKRNGTPGLIYFSRLPPGMGPAQIKHLLGAYGEVGRVFLARASAFVFDSSLRCVRE